MKKNEKELQFGLYINRKSPLYSSRNALEDSIRMLVLFAETNKLSVIACYTDIDGQTIGYDQMVQSLDEGKINGIICDDISRMCRTQDRFLKVLNLLQKGIVIKTPEKEYTNSVNDTGYFYIVAGIAQMYNTNYHKKGKQK